MKIKIPGKPIMLTGFELISNITNSIGGFIVLLESYVSNDEVQSFENGTLFESIKLLDDAKNTVDNIKDLYDQWKKTTDKFVNKKWIYRYTDEKQRDALKKHWDNLVDPNVYYSVYKRSFKAICKFMGLPHDEVILEWIRFTKDEVDKGQLKVSVRYSRGKVKVKIPKGVRLIHVSPVAGIRPFGSNILRNFNLNREDISCLCALIFS